MSSLQIGFAGLGVVVVLLALRVPIAFALGSVALVGMWLVRGPVAAFGALGSLTYDFAANWSLSAVPMFLLLGAIAYHTGFTNHLYSAARIWTNWMPGGLAVATNFASAGFSAMCGSSVATAAAMGRMAIPEMLDRGYDKALAAGTVAAAGTLGALIPPSVLFILYGWFSEEPIDKLLIAGIFPGLLTAFMYALMIVMRCTANPALAPKVHIENAKIEMPELADTIEFEADPYKAAECAHAIAVLKADRNLPYGEVEQLIAAIEASDAPHVALATREQDEEAPR